MCIGVPMRVVESLPGRALCDAGAGELWVIDMLLVGEQPPGTWVLTFLDAAREVVPAEQAELVRKALHALKLAGAGEATTDAIDALFPDLAGRTPELPAHLRPAVAPTIEKKVTA